MGIRYAVIFEKAKTNWAAYVPDLPGCMTTGQTLEGHITTLREFGDPVPVPTTVAREIEISPAA
jgi:predicted RNase H-like HicB family nuclease